MVLDIRAVGAWRGGEQIWDRSPKKKLHFFFVGGSPHTNKKSEKGKFSEGANSKAFGRAQDEKSFKADSSTLAPLKRLEMEINC